MPKQAQPSSHRVKLTPCRNVWLLLWIVLLGHGIMDLSRAVEPIGVPDRDEIEYPDDTSPSEAEVFLGKVLFFDERLSHNDHTSCASCHNPDLGFGDGLALGMGTYGNRLERHTPHLYNLAWNTLLLWDGSANSLEAQVLGPITKPGEMSMPLSELVSKLKQVPFYRDSFTSVYPDEGITPETIARAIAAFERTLISDNSPFDRYLQGDQHAMSPAAIRGMGLFNGKASCVACHNGPNFTNESFHNLGVGGDDPARAAIVDDRTLHGAFKTPGLRNALLTAPYMHDGSIGTLEEVMQFYNTGGRPARTKTDMIKPLYLTENEIFDLVAFLGSLTGPVIIKRPVIPPSQGQVTDKTKKR